MNAPKEPKLRTLPADLRNYIARWQPGLVEHVSEFGAITWLPAKRRYAAGYYQFRIVQNLCECGYLTTDKALTRGSTDFTLTRTAKPLREYRPQKNPRPYKGTVFPWSTAEHWRRIDGSPWRVHRAVMAKLAGKKKAKIPERWRPEQDSWAEHLAAPTFVETQNELAVWRDALAWAFGLPTGRKHSVVLPASYPWVAASPVTLRMVLLDLLIQPVFENGRCVRFQPVDPHKAEEELRRLAMGSTPTEKYLNYLQA